MSEDSNKTPGTIVTPVGKDVVTLNPYTSQALEMELQASFKDVITVDASKMDVKSGTDLDKSRDKIDVNMGSIPITIGQDREKILIKHAVKSVAFSDGRDTVKGEGVVEAVVGMRPVDYKVVLEACNELAEANKAPDDDEKKG